MAQSYDDVEQLRQLLKRMRDEPICHDVVFFVNGERFPALREVMAAASPVLRSMLTNGMKETNEREITLGEVNVAVWRKVMDFVYTGKVQFSNINDALSVLECAHRFEITQLESKTHVYLRKYLDKDTCTPILVAADRYNATDLLSSALEKYSRYFDSFYLSNQFSRLNAQLVQTILQRSDLSWSSRLNKFSAAMNWLIRNKEPGAGKGNLDRDVEYKIAVIAWELMDEEGLTIPEIEAKGISCGITQGSSAILNALTVTDLDDTELKLLVRLTRKLANTASDRHNVHLPVIEELFEKTLLQLVRKPNNNWVREYYPGNVELYVRKSNT